MEVAGTQNRCGHTVAAFAAAQEMGYGCLRAGRARGGHMVSEKPGCEYLSWRIAMGCAVHGAL